jgi:hypothetical protein
MDLKMTWSAQECLRAAIKLKAKNAAILEFGGGSRDLDHQEDAS